MRQVNFTLIILCCFITSRAQTSITMAGNLSSLISDSRHPELRNYGLGGLIKLEWINASSNIRFIEMGVDQFNRRATFNGPGYTQIKNYVDVLVRIQRGYRTFIGGNNTGLHTDLGIGLALNVTEGYGKSDGDFHFGGGLSAGFGFCNKIINVGMQLHIMVTRYSGHYIYPGVHLGLRIAGKKK